MRLRDWVVALSLSNLCFLGVWAALQDRTQLYLRKVPPSYSEAGAITLDVVLFGAVLWAIIRLASSRKRLVPVAARFAFLALLVLPIRNIQFQFPEIWDPLARGFLGRTGVLIVFALAVVAAVVWNRRAAQAATALLLIMAPLFPINVISSLMMAHSLHGSAYADQRAPAIRETSAAKSRVVILIFDELDYRIAFQDRPPSIHLPELDRLRAESLFATNAFPAQHETVLSIPSILTGREVSAAVHKTSDELVLRSGNATLRFSTAATLFSEARKRGFRTALIGWFHAYCRLLGDDTDECFCEPGVSDRPEWARPIPMLKSMWFDVRRQLAITPLVHMYRDSSDIARPEHIREYLSIHKRALAAAVDPSFGLVFLHYPVPHPPGIYDPRKAALDSTKHHGYVDNLPLVDRSLGELRAAMERTGTWDSTTLIVTADHPLRVDFWPDEIPIWGPVGSPLVPFLVKLENETRGVTYGGAVNNRIVHDLALALLTGRIHGTEKLVRWLDSRDEAEPQKLSHVPLHGSPQS